MLYSKLNKVQSGFTLIELLVVIAIIGLLASLVLVALNSSRQKSRVAKRAANLNQLAKAMELYYNDNKSYPNNGSTYRSQCLLGGGYAANQVVWDTTLNQGIVPTYISAFPSDPSMNPITNENCYMYFSNGTDYKLYDINLTDMTLADIDKYSALKDPCRNVANAGCAGINDARLTWAVGSTVGMSQW